MFSNNLKGINVLNSHPILQYLFLELANVEEEEEDPEEEVIIEEQVTPVPAVKNEGNEVIETKGLVFEKDD